MAEGKKTTGSAKKADASSSKKTDSAQEQKVKTEEYHVTSDTLMDELKKIVREGNVQRVIVRAKDGRELLNLPLTIGVIGLALAPFWIAVAAVVGIASEYTIVVERRED